MRSGVGITFTAMIRVTPISRSTSTGNGSTTPPSVKVSLPIATVGPQRADVRAHARTGDHVHFDAVFLQHLDHTNVREAFGAAGRERQSDEAAAEIARQAPQVGVE